MPYDEYYNVPKKHHANPPSLSLLRVNKMVRAEAIQILYGKNTWRIGPLAPETYPPFDSSDPNRHLWSTYQDIFRHVVIYFNQFDINPESAYKYALLKKEEDPNTTPTLRRDMFHNMNRTLMTVTWLKKLYVVLVP